jgi:hypothetical protein
MTVPETTVHEQDGLSLRKNKVGPAGKPSCMQSKPQPKTMSGFSDEDFGCRILSMNGSHH